MKGAKSFCSPVRSLGHGARSWATPEFGQLYGLEPNPVSKGVRDEGPVLCQVVLLHSDNSLFASHALDTLSLEVPYNVIAHNQDLYSHTKLILCVARKLEQGNSLIILNFPTQSINLIWRQLLFSSLWHWLILLLQDPDGCSLVLDPKDFGQILSVLTILFWWSDPAVELCNGFVILVRMDDGKLKSVVPLTFCIDRCHSITSKGSEQGMWHRPILSFLCEERLVE